MKNWIEILKTGQHIDRMGRPKSITEADLDTMVRKYDPAHHEAPVVIGHPKTNAPAYGWVEALKRDGSKLMAKFKQVQPEFSEMVTSGLFKKRSASIYADGTLRHVGFLGAQPPAIKGLRDIEFADDEAQTFEFEEQVPTTTTTQTEEIDMDLTAMQKKLADETAAREKAENEAKTWKSQAEKTASEFSESQTKARKKEISDWVDKMMKKIPPGWKEQGLVEFMEAVEGLRDGEANTFEFSEGKKQTPVAWLMDRITEFAEHPLFKDMVPPKDDKAGGEHLDFSESLTHKV